MGEYESMMGLRLRERSSISLHTTTMALSVPPTNRTDDTDPFFWKEDSFSSNS